MVAVNVGGCLIPAGLAIYELFHLVADDRPALWAAGAASCALFDVSRMRVRQVFDAGHFEDRLRIQR
ncbi:DUF1614 domain-containing protein [Methylocystis sp. IM2]|uniref:DUF1614 domain-containing protein n=1 Tax=unclassified Methylocystis TaxID=2625913 RepID=UPI0040484A5A